MGFHFRIEGYELLEKKTKRWGKKVIVELPNDWQDSFVIVVKK